MGIDLSTGGREGLKVYPVSDGVIFKVKAHRRGYGNAIYIRHSNGKSSVYAHLAEFGPKIQKALLAEKVKVGTPFGERALNVSVNQGDCIAYSGESGSGLPHFHFEIRDASNRPLNPIHEGLHHQLPKQETLVVKAIRLFPLTTDSSVNGSFFPVELSDFSRPVQARGTIGIEILGYVLLANDNRLGFSAIELNVNGITHGASRGASRGETHLGTHVTTLGQWKPSKLSYDFNGQGGSVYNRYFSGFSPTQYVYRFNHFEDPRLPGYSFSSMLKVEGDTTMTVSLRGVTSSRAIALELSPKVTSKMKSSSHFYGHPEDYTMWQGRIRYQDRSTKQTQIRVLQEGTRLNGSFLPEDVTYFGRLPNRKSQPFELGEWRVSSSIPSQMIALETVSKTREGLSPISSALMFEDCGKPVKALSLTWNQPEGVKNAQQLGLYSWSPNKRKWRFEESVSEKSNRFNLPFFMKCVILRDTAKPVIGKIKTHTYFKGKKKVISIRDRQSGVQWETTRLFMKGENMNLDIDRDRGWIILPDQLLFPLKVEAKDRAGNTTSYTFNTL